MKTYDPKKVMVQFGNRQITGFSQDDIITIQPNGEGVQRYVGADGEVQRAVDPDMTYNVTLTLANTSKSNDYLSGSLLFFAQEAWVQNMPESGRGRQIDSQEWSIHTGAVEGPIFGGNDE